LVQQIIKRDGRLEPFDKQKIIMAIYQAYRDGDAYVPEPSERIASAIEMNPKDTLDVEEVQDLVEQGLINERLPDVAKRYILYRAERSRIRRERSDLSRRVTEVLDGAGIRNSNANVDEYSFGGRKFEVANALHREFALEKYMSAEVAQAHRDHRIYIHDLSEYTVGDHNCLFVDLQRLLSEGFETRNGTVRPAQSFSTACQLVAVIFQCQSQVQFGGVASAHIDYDLAPYVRKSFARHMADGLIWVEGAAAEALLDYNSDVFIDDKANDQWPRAKAYAMAMLEREGSQAAQGLYHNLNTLESRAGSQLPFSSINFGTDTSPEGRLVTKWLLEASIAGIGKHRTSPIFPISVFKYKRGINDVLGTPNYDLRLLSEKSLCNRIYPNIVNCGFSRNEEDGGPDTEMATMGCRTMLGFDRNGLGYSKIGRGNVCPVTINLPRIALRHRPKGTPDWAPDLDGFWAELDEVLGLAKMALLERYERICSQPARCAPFMYKNGTIADAGLSGDEGVEPAMRHSTLALGYIGIAEMCQALFGKNHAEDDDVHAFALEVVQHIYDFCVASGEAETLNFSCYATPAESLCHTYAKALREEFGLIENVTDRKYITNSHHVPVWMSISVMRKLEVEAPFCKYATGGCITYVELDGSVMKNPEAVRSIVDYAMGLDTPYLAFNFPIDTCDDCGFSGEIEGDCPACESGNITRLRRVTGYLTRDYRNFNSGKVAECLDRVKHTTVIEQFDGQMRWTEV